MEEKTKEYKKALKNLASRKDDMYFSNAGVLHTLFTYTNILRTCKEVKFFISELDLELANSSKLEKKFKKFLNNGLILKVINGGSSENKLIKLIKYYSELFPERVQIKELENFGINNNVIFGDNRAFCFTKEGYNEEGKQVNIACFNDPEKVKLLTNKFEELWQK